MLSFFSGVVVRLTSITYPGSSVFPDFSKSPDSPFTGVVVDSVCIIVFLETVAMSVYLVTGFPACPGLMFSMSSAGFWLVVFGTNDVTTNEGTCILAVLVVDVVSFEVVLIVFVDDDTCDDTLLVGWSVAILTVGTVVVGTWVLCVGVKLLAFAGVDLIAGSIGVSAK